MMISSQNAAMMISSQKAEEATPGGRGPATGPAGTPQRQPRPRRRTCQHAPECREPYPLASISSMTAWIPQQSLRPSPRERGRPGALATRPRGSPPLRSASTVAEARLPGGRGANMKATRCRCVAQPGGRGFPRRSRRRGDSRR